MLLIRDFEAKELHSASPGSSGSAAVPAMADGRDAAVREGVAPVIAPGGRSMKGRRAAGRKSRPSARELDRAAAAYVEGEDRARNLAFICDVCRPRLLKYFRRKRVPLADCEDLTQETLIRVTENLGDFRGDCPVLAYIFRIAANVRNRWLRGGEPDRFQVSLDQDESVREQPEDPHRSPEENAARKELRALMDREIERLPPKMRACLELRHRGLPYREIARLLHSKVSTVGVNIKNAKDRLKKILAQRLDMNDGAPGGSDGQDRGRD